jgi:hypothetical protein
LGLHITHGQDPRFASLHIIFRINSGSGLQAFLNGVYMLFDFLYIIQKRLNLYWKGNDTRGNSGPFVEAGLVVYGFADVYSICVF